MSLLEELIRKQKRAEQEIEQEKNRLSQENQRIEQARLAKEAQERLKQEDEEFAKGLEITYQELADYLGKETNPKIIWLFCVLLSNKAQRYFSPQGIPMGGSQIFNIDDLVNKLESLKRIGK